MDRCGLIAERQLQDVMEKMTGFGAHLGPSSGALFRVTNARWRGIEIIEEF